ncbi:MAG: methyltransferase, partial [Caulobacter sp.]
MRPARLDLAISAAMRPAPTPAPDPVSEPPAPSGPPPRRRFALARRLLAPVVAPVANYARRYLQASVEHELRQTQGQVQALSAELAQTQGLLHLALQQQQSTAVVLQAMAAQLNRIEGHSARAEDHGIRIEGLSRKLDGDIAGLPGVFGPRFDELEIKQRPLIAYDDESMAIRMRDGYVLAPRNLPTFVTMLANATSRGLEPGTGDVLRRLVQPGMVVADVGANIGLLTLVMAWAT